MRSMMAIMGMGSMCVLSETIKLGSTQVGFSSFRV